MARMPAPIMVLRRFMVPDLMVAVVMIKSVVVGFSRSIVRFSVQASSVCSLLHSLQSAANSTRISFVIYSAINNT